MAKLIRAAKAALAIREIGRPEAWWRWVHYHQL